MGIYYITFQKQQTMHDDGSRIKTIIYTYKSCVSLADVWMMMMICIASISAAHLSPSLSLVFMFLYANCRRQWGRGSVAILCIDWASPERGGGMKEWKIQICMKNSVSKSFLLFFTFHVCAFLSFCCFSPSHTARRRSFELEFFSHSPLRAVENE